MSCRGVHFALTPEDVLALISLESDAERLLHVQEVIEEHYFSGDPKYLGESDKAWDAMHRALSDGMLTWDGGEYPLNHAVLAGELLYHEADYVMSLKRPEAVQDVSVALERVTEDEFRERYSRIDVQTYQDKLSEDDFQYTWEWLQRVRALYRTAAKDHRFVLFTVDQ